MKNPTLSNLKKCKQRRILVLSAGTVVGGIQCLYLAAGSDTGEIITHTFLPYPQKCATLLDQFAPNTPLAIKPADLAWLDYKMTLFFVECATTTLSQLPTLQRTPHLLVLNKPSLWRGETGEELQQTTWDYSLGDAQYLSNMTKTPVITDFIRHNVLAGGQGVLPLNPGNQRIINRCGGTVALINIGLVARMTIINTVTSEVLVDSDTGPGTCCINTIFKKVRSTESVEGFDRDGSQAASGSVDGEILKTLSETAWFLKPAPKQASPDYYSDLLENPAFVALPPNDQLATITALSARSIYDFYRREFKGSPAPHTIYLSGGGSNNQTLVKYLTTFFDTLPLVSIEELGVPLDMRIPFALGLTVNALVSGCTVPWESGHNPRMGPTGRWVFPES